MPSDTSASAPLTLPIALVCSVPLEAAPVLARLAHPEPVIIGRRRATRGTLAGRPVVLLAGGMGKVNAAQAVTALLEGREVDGVIGFGVGGAFAGGGAEVGGVALATEEIYGDEGVEAPGGWISTEGIGIPLLDSGGTRLFNRLPLDSDRVGAARAALAAAGIHAVPGPFVTVSACSGTARRGAELRERFDAVCESMEGAAVVHVAALYAVPCLEVRGISNQVEDRDLTAWRLPAAASAAAAAVEAMVRGWNDRG